MPKIVESSVPFTHVSAVEKRNFSELDLSDLNIGDTVIFVFKLWSLDSSDAQTKHGEIIDMLDVCMNNIRWLTDGHVDNNYNSAWYPNCDLSQTMVPNSGSEDDDYNDSSTVQTKVTTFPQVNEQTVLTKNTCVSVCYGFMKSDESTKVQIQENGIVTAVDLNTEKVTWYKISFPGMDENQYWYSWQKAEDMQLHCKKQRRT